MNNTNDQDLEKLLESRVFVNPRANLADRIIAAARLQQHKCEETAIEWLQGLFRDFIVIKPAYTLLLILIVGIFTGFVGTIQNSGTQGIGIHTNQAQAHQAQDFLHIREEFI